MAKRDIIDDLADIVHPLPDPLPQDADDDTRDGHWAWTDQVQRDREKFEESTRLSWEHTDTDPLLGLISQARRDMREAEKRMRLLIAYGREFTAPRPYRLEDLAQATGMSISGTRTAYDEDEITEVADRIGRRPRIRTTPISS